MLLVSLASQDLGAVFSLAKGLKALVNNTAYLARAQQFSCRPKHLKIIIKFV